MKSFGEQQDSHSAKRTNQSQGGWSGLMVLIMGDTNVFLISTHSALSRVTDQVYAGWMLGWTDKWTATQEPVGLVLEDIVTSSSEFSGQP